MITQRLTFSDPGDIFDGPHATPKRQTEGPYFLNIASLDDGRLDLTQSDHVSREDFERWTKRITPQEGDLLFSYETRLGDAALMPAGIEACLGRRMALLRPNRERVDPRFLLYFYLSPAVRQIIDRRTIHGATVNRIGLSTMGSWPIIVPALSEQRAVAEVLGALDDKIATNARLVETADSLAKATFAAISSETDSLPLTEVARFVNGKAFTKGASGTGRVVVRIAEINSGIGNSTVYSDAVVADQHLVRPGDVLFAWSGSLTVCRWFRPEAIVNQHIFKVIPASGYPIWCVYGLIAAKLDEFKSIAAGKATTMGHIQRHHLEEPVSVPTMAQIERHDAAMTALWKRALLAEQESLSLTDIRDALLPLLMSGKLRVKDAKKVAEEVL